MAPRQARPAAAAARVERLLEFWGTKKLTAVTPSTCREYAEHRKEVERDRRAQAQKERKTTSKKKLVTVSGGGSRRDLEDLRSAINHHAKRELHTGLVTVDLPEKGGARQEWLTRSDAARLLWTCWRHTRAERPWRGKHKGAIVQSDWHDLRHVARFILMGIYTASRPGAIYSASIKAGSNRSFIDLESGIFFRLADGARATNKRQPPAPIPARLLAHLRRWKAKGIIAQHVVEWDAKPVKSIKVAWAQMLAAAGMDRKITPHTLRHTACTWMMQNGVDIWEAAGFAGMSEKMMRDTYGHQHPSFMKTAADRITRKKTVSLP